MRDKRKPIEAMIDSVMKCVNCGAKMGTCDCWANCSCGWLYERLGECGNPIHKGKP